MGGCPGNTRIDRISYRDDAMQIITRRARTANPEADVELATRTMGLSAVSAGRSD